MPPRFRSRELCMQAHVRDGAAHSVPRARHAPAPGAAADPLRPLRDHRLPQGRPGRALRGHNFHPRTFFAPSPPRALGLQSLYKSLHTSFITSTSTNSYLYWWLVLHSTSTVTVWHLYPYNTRTETLYTARSSHMRKVTMAWGPGPPDIFGKWLYPHHAPQCTSIFSIELELSIHRE